MPANFLNSTALPSITGLAASGPMSPRPSTAVPLVTTATRLPRLVAEGGRGVGRRSPRRPQPAGRIGQRQVALVDHLLGGVDGHLPGVGNSWYSRAARRNSACLCSGFTMACVSWGCRTGLARAGIAAHRPAILRRRGHATAMPRNCVPMDRPPSPAPPAGPPCRVRRAVGVLVALLVVAQSLLVALTLNYESTRAQDAADSAAADAAAEMKRELLRSTQVAAALSWRGRRRPRRWRRRRTAAHAARAAARRARDPALAVAAAVDSPFATPPCSSRCRARRARAGNRTRLRAARAARRRPRSRTSYFVPLPEAGARR